VKTNDIWGKKGSSSHKGCWPNLKNRGQAGPKTACPVASTNFGGGKKERGSGKGGGNRNDNNGKKPGRNQAEKQKKKHQNRGGDRIRKIFEDGEIGIKAGKMKNHRPLNKKRKPEEFAWNRPGGCALSRPKRIAEGKKRTKTRIET